MNRFAHILVPTDFGEASERALTLALTLASRFGSKVTLLHATWVPPAYYSAYAEGLAWPVEELEGQANLKLHAVATAARKAHADVETAFFAAEPYEAILETARERACDLIVMGTHGRTGARRMLLGSVAEKIVRLSPVPVLTVS